ncbi:MAG: DUF835 domain-containing protein [Thermoplasmatota archaeon]
MRQADPEFVQILNIIRRGQRLVLQAKKQGADVSMAEELLNEAKYALKLNKREQAIEYSKKSIVEVVKIKREMTKQTVNTKEDLEGLTKAELRNLCKQYELDSVGVKDELVERIWKHIEERPEEPRKVAPPKIEKEETKKEEEPIEKEEKPPEKKDGWDPEEEVRKITPGLSYLIEEKRPDRFFTFYGEMKKSGKPGLIISRTNPKILSRKYEISEEETVWLTGKEIHGEIRSVLPILEFIMSLIEDYMDKNDNGLILLDGLEYLLTNNKFNSVIRFLRQLVDNVSQTECVLLVSLSPEALDPTQVTLLEKDLVPLNYTEP